MTITVNGRVQSMNGYVKSPWKWNEIFEVCAKYYFLERNDTSFKHVVHDDDVNELYVLSSTEGKTIYLNSELVETYRRISKAVKIYEENNGEIVA